MHLRGELVGLEVVAELSALHPFEIDIGALDGPSQVDEPLARRENLQKQASNQVSLRNSI